MGSGSPPFPTIPISTPTLPPESQRGVPNPFDSGTRVHDGASGRVHADVPAKVSAQEEYLDKRLSLVGNAWSVPVVTWFIGQLVGSWGLAPALTPQQVMQRLNVEGNPFLQSRLMRPPLRPDLQLSPTTESSLVNQLGRLVSTKGADLMLTSSPDEISEHQRLRHTVNPKMWKWKVVAGWKWLGRTHKCPGNACYPGMLEMEIGTSP